MALARLLVEVARLGWQVHRELEQARAALEVQAWRDALARRLRLRVGWPADVNGTLRDPVIAAVLDELPAVAPAPEPAPGARRVFLSYSQESPAHSNRVLELAQQLRRDGLDSRLDQFLPGGPPEGWPRWMQRQVAEADRILVICTPTYRRRFEGQEQPGPGRGVDWEGLLLVQQLYEARSHNTRIIPVRFEDADEQAIPLPLRPFNHYQLPRQYAALLRVLTERPRVIPEPMGPVCGPE